MSIGGVYESLGWFSSKTKLPISPEIPSQISGEIVPHIPQESVLSIINDIFLYFQINFFSLIAETSYGYHQIPMSLGF